MGAAVRAIFDRLTDLHAAYPCCIVDFAYLDGRVIVISAIFEEYSMLSD